MNADAGAGRGPETFEFTPENLEKARAIIARYPEGRQMSAVIPLLDLAQRQGGGWLSRAAIEYVADFLGMAHIRAEEVATFYTMFMLKPVGRHVVNVCTTTPCWLRGSDEIVEACRRFLGISFDETTEDGLFTLKEVECLGACVNAPVVEIDDHYYEDLDAESVTRILEALRNGETPKPGPQVDRLNSAPIGGLTTLKEAEPAGDA